MFICSLCFLVRGFDPSSSSVIGLAFIAGYLLLQSPEEDAFWIFISLMDSHLRPYFSSNAIQLDIDASLFAKAMENVDPTIAKKLFTDMAIAPIRICRPWWVFPVLDFACSRASDARSF
jgi:hypothetical protein